MITHAAWEVLDELGHGGREFRVEPAMGAPGSDSRQIRVLDETGDGKAVVVNFEDTGDDLEDIKARIREQLKVLI